MIPIVHLYCCCRCQTWVGAANRWVPCWFSDHRRKICHDVQPVRLFRSWLRLVGYSTDTCHFMTDFYAILNLSILANILSSFTANCNLWANWAVSRLCTCSFVFFNWTLSFRLTMWFHEVLSSSFIINKFMRVFNLHPYLRFMIRNSTFIGTEITHKYITISHLLSSKYLCRSFQKQPNKKEIAFALRLKS